jgi:hypothetical protein
MNRHEGTDRPFRAGTMGSMTLAYLVQHGEKRGVAG